MYMIEIDETKAANLAQYAEKAMTCLHNLMSCISEEDSEDSYSHRTSRRDYDRNFTREDDRGYSRYGSGRYFRY